MMQNYPTGSIYEIDISLEMSSVEAKRSNKPHAMFVPFPAQGHINPILGLAKLLHRHGGIHVTFVNTDYNHRRLLRSHGPGSLNGPPGFLFESIPDGLPHSDADATQDIPSLCASTSKNCLEPFLNLISRLNDTPDSPPVSCVICDGVMPFALDAAERIGVPGFAFWTSSACGVLAYTHYHKLAEKGLVPFKDADFMMNGDLDVTVDFVPAMKGARLRDFPSSIRITDPDAVVFNMYIRAVAKTVKKASAVILNTFDLLEKDALEAISTVFPPLYTVGPLQLVMDQIPDDNLKSVGSNLWKEDPGCIEWLDSREPSSVIYVNFGSITVMTPQVLLEFAWGLANSRKPFLWVVRPDLVVGGSGVFPPEFLVETRDRGRLVGWCPQERVLKHASIRGFLTHCGWNSTIESICGGVPFLSWPFFSEQPVNCYFSRTAWGIGAEISRDVKRDEVESLVQELMDGKKGEVMRRKADEWKTAAEEAVRHGGSSYKNLEELVTLVLCKGKDKLIQVSCNND